jgi:hypothetical protein
MTEEMAKAKAARLQRYVKHPTLNYRRIKVTEHKWGIGQFLGDEQVGVV